MFADHVITSLRLNQIGIPVKVINYDPHCLHLRMLGQNLIQRICRIMERKSNMFDFSGLFPLFHIVKHMRFPDNLLVTHGVDIMKKVVVKVFHTTAV